MANNENKKKSEHLRKDDTLLWNSLGELLSINDNKYEKKSEHLHKDDNTDYRRIDPVNIEDGKFNADNEYEKKSAEHLRMCKEFMRKELVKQKDELVDYENKKKLDILRVYEELDKRFDTKSDTTDYRRIDPVKLKHKFGIETKDFMEYQELLTTLEDLATTIDFTYKYLGVVTTIRSKDGDPCTIEIEISNIPDEQTWDDILMMFKTDMNVK